jgi:hypothetical protein
MMTSTGWSKIRHGFLCCAAVTDAPQSRNVHAHITKTPYSVWTLKQGARGTRASFLLRVQLELRGDIHEGGGAVAS